MTIYSTSSSSVVVVCNGCHLRMYNDMAILHVVLVCGDIHGLDYRMAEVLSNQ